MPKKDNADHETIPVAREELRVGKRQRETATVTVNKTVRSRKQVVNVPLAKQTVKMKRVAVNRFVTQTQPARQEGDVTIIPLYEEVVVVKKRLLLREEVRITRERTVTHHPQEVTLRAEEVKVERRPVGGRAKPDSRTK